VELLEELQPMAAALAASTMAATVRPDLDIAYRLQAMGSLSTVIGDRFIGGLMADQDHLTVAL
jgi:hypothetical protein